MKICVYFATWLYAIAIPIHVISFFFFEFNFYFLFQRNDFNLNWLRKTIKKELNPIKAKIRKNLYFYFIDLIGDLKKIFFFFSKKWLLDHYL